MYRCLELIEERSDKRQKVHQLKKIYIYIYIYIYINRIFLFQKLNAIAKLKGELECGKTLEKDQLEKIATEEKLMKDLEDLII